MTASRTVWGCVVCAWYVRTRSVHAAGIRHKVAVPNALLPSLVRNRALSTDPARTLETKRTPPTSTTSITLTNGRRPPCRDEAARGDHHRRRRRRRDHLGLPRGARRRSGRQGRRHRGGRPSTPYGRWPRHPAGGRARHRRVGHLWRRRRRRPVHLLERQHRMRRLPARASCVSQLAAHLHATDRGGGRAPLPAVLLLRLRRARHFVRPLGDALLRGEWELRVGHTSHVPSRLRAAPRSEAPRTRQGRAHHLPVLRRTTVRTPGDRSRLDDGGCGQTSEGWWNEWPLL